MHDRFHPYVLSAGLALTVVLVSASMSVGGVSLPQVFGDNMVLQRDLPVPVWGWADTGEQVIVSFAAQRKTAVAGDDGRWAVRLDPLKANKLPADMVVTGSNTVTFRNVVVGDVWLCSGQSNMAMGRKAALQSKEEAATADYPAIRLLAGHGKTPQDFPLGDRKASWTVCTPRTARGFTAVGFFFGRTLFREVGVPIGLISASSGGTPVEAWTPPVGFRRVPELTELNELLDEWDVTTEKGNRNFRQYISAMRKWLAEAKTAVDRETRLPYSTLPHLPGRGKDKRTPTANFNGAISPLIPYAIRGAIWYQGESNGGEGHTYFLKMKALIGGWRALWQQGEFPFYFVQLANIHVPRRDNPAGGDGWAKIREAQRETLCLPNTGMAVAIDVGEAHDIHPKNKQDVGVRLALWTLARDYGKDIVYSGPLYRAHNVDGNAIRVSFDHCGTGLMFGKKTGPGAVQKLADAQDMWISVAGSDRKWHWADVEIEGGYHRGVERQGAEAGCRAVRVHHQPGPCLALQQGGSAGIAVQDG